MHYLRLGRDVFYCGCGVEDEAVEGKRVDDE